MLFEYLFAKLVGQCHIGAVFARKLAPRTCESLTILPANFQTAPLSLRTSQITINETAETEMRQVYGYCPESDAPITAIKVSSRSNHC